MFDRLLRAAYRRMTPHGRNNLRTWLALEQRDSAPIPIPHFRQPRVLVLAPHSDDEVIGCGGSLAKHVRAGSAVHVAFMTDGRWGDGALFSPHLTIDERQVRQAELITTRKREAHEAAAVLGVQHLHFLDMVDSALSVKPSSVASVLSILTSVKPDVVYLPFVYDLHEDHWQTNRIFSAAAAMLPFDISRSLLVRGYEVWSPLLANCYADISDVMPLKLAALATFQSQLKDQNYLHIVQGLNAYRSNGAMGGNGYAEAFHEAPLAAYQRLIQAAELKSRAVPPHSA